MTWDSALSRLLICATNRASPTSVHLASLPQRGSPFRLEGECDLERIISCQISWQNRRSDGMSWSVNHLYQSKTDQSHSFRFTCPSIALKHQAYRWVDSGHVNITFRATHTAIILFVSPMDWSISAAFFAAVFVCRHYLLLISSHVWHGFVCHLQPPHLSHRQISESGICNASTTFLTPTHPQSIHWYSLNPSGKSIESSHKNSVLRLQPLHLNCV